MHTIDQLRKMAQLLGAEALTIEERCAIKGISEWQDLPEAYHADASRAVGTNIHGHVVQTKTGPVALTNIGQLAIKRLSEQGESVDDPSGDR